MHNCKTTRNSLIDLALDETRASARSTESERLLAELAECSSCRAEYASLRGVLDTVDQATECASPGENFWPGYRTRLRQRIQHAASSAPPAEPIQPRTSVWSAVKKIAGASVRIPVPVAAVTLLFFGVAMFVVVQGRGQAKAEAATPRVVVETKTIEVPVVQEKVVTRVVYVARNRQSIPVQPSQIRDPGFSSTMAQLPKDALEQAAASLSGFRPTDQVKLTIIKGSYHDEK